MSPSGKEVIGLSKTKHRSMGAGVPLLGGLVNAAAGKHAHKTTGKNGSGFGHTEKQSRDNYNSLSSKKK